MSSLYCPGEPAAGHRQQPRLPQGDLRHRPGAALAGYRLDRSWLWAGRCGSYQAGSRLIDPGMGPVNRRWVLGGSGVKVVGVWTPNFDPRTVIIAVPWVFTQYTAVEAASVPDRFWYRTCTGFPVRTENSVRSEE